MRRIISDIFLIFFSALIYFSCANIKPPQGGPKDTIPPVLVKSIPPNKSLNFKGNTIRLIYNEKLNIGSIKKNVIITPMSNIDFQDNIHKNSVEITFLSPLKDSTTYTLNFQSAIKDITEGNITKDNTFAFSTGNYIDSIHIAGITTYLLKTDTFPKITVGLYDVMDTFDMFKGRPLYFTKSDEHGAFRIENIKAGKYFLQAFNDANNNLKCDIPREAHAFDPDTITLRSNMDSLNIKLLSLDIRPLKIQKALPSGKYFEVTFNKNIINYNIETLDTSQSLYYNLFNYGKAIRFYNTLKKDSAGIILNVMDSVNNELKDTLYVKFQESKRKKEDFNYTIEPPNKSVIDPDFTAEINFTKPVKLINTDSLYIRYDSANIDTLTLAKNFSFNKNRSIVTLHVKLNKDLLQTKNTESPENKPENNSANTSAKTQGTKMKQTGPTLYLGVGAFISVEDDSSKQIAYSYQIRKEENYGIVRGTVHTQFKSFFIQLLDKKYNVIDQLNSVTDYSFINIPEGNYRIRVLVDNNNNGRWDPGNYYKSQTPEKVYFYPKTLTLRANWELRDIDLTF